MYKHSTFIFVYKRQFNGDSQLKIKLFNENYSIIIQLFNESKQLHFYSTCETRAGGRCPATW